MNDNLNVWLDSTYFMLDTIHRNWLQRPLQPHKVHLFKVFVLIKKTAKISCSMPETTQPRSHTIRMQTYLKQLLTQKY